MTEKHEDDVSAPGYGRLLRRTRESLGLSVEDIASELHLSQRQIEALEEDDWDTLPGVTYARGYVRSYARLIGLDAEQLLAGSTTEEIEISRVEPEISADKKLEITAEPEPAAGQQPETTIDKKQESTSDQQPETAVDKQPETITDNKPKISADKTEHETEPVISRPPWGLIGGAGVIVLAVLLAWQLQEGTFTPETPGGEEVSSLQHEGDQLPEPDAGAAMATSDEESADAAGTGASGETDVSATDQPPTPTEPQQVVFQFDQSSWVDVRDASGVRLLYRNIQAGRRVEVEGQPPFHVFLGNARGVQIEYLGGTVTPDIRSGRLYARFVLEPSG